MARGWQVIYSDDRDDCVPVNDLARHTLSDSCRCSPFLSSTPSGKPLGIHHSFDGREHSEPDYAGEYENRGRYN